MGNISLSKRRSLLCNGTNGGSATYMADPLHAANQDQQHLQWSCADRQVSEASLPVPVIKKRLCIAPESALELLIENDKLLQPQLKETQWFFVATRQLFQSNPQHIRCALAIRRRWSAYCNLTVDTRPNTIIISAGTAFSVDTNDWRRTAKNDGLRRVQSADTAHTRSGRTSSVTLSQLARAM